MYNVVGGSLRACKNWSDAQLMRPDHVHYLPEAIRFRENYYMKPLLKPIMNMFPIDIDFSRLLEAFKYNPDAPMIFHAAEFFFGCSLRLW